MKKITLIVALIVAPFIASAQTFNFDAAGGDFTTWNNLSDNADGTANLTGGVSSTTTSGVVPANKYAVITLKNTSNNGYIRFSNPKDDGSGRQYASLVISTNDSDFKTYIIDMSSNSDWNGTATTPVAEGGFENDIKLHVKADAGTNASFAGEEAVIIDKIVFTASTTEKNSYTFDVNEEGWSATNGTNSNVGGNLVFTPNAASFAKLVLAGYHINATSNNYMHITLKNESTTDETLRVILDGSNTDIALTTGDTGFTTYDVNLSGKTGWSGDVSNIQLGLRDADNGNQSSGSGDLIIDSIVFDNNSTLGNTSVSKIEGAVVNTNNGNITVSGANLDAVYNVAGQQVGATGLTAGIYIVKISKGAKVAAVKVAL